jgi:acyl-CoA thioesterase
MLTDRSHDLLVKDLEHFGVEMDEGATSGITRITPKLVTPVGRIYGGACLAIAVAALQRSTGRLPVWVTTQFIDNDDSLDHVELVVEEKARGKRASQAQVHVSGHGRLLYTGFGVLTERVGDGEPVATWAEMPVVCAPEDAPESIQSWHTDDELDDSCWGYIEIRDATPKGEAAKGRVQLWTRVPGHPSYSATTLAYLADVMPMGFNRIGDTGGPSMDNTIRYVAERETEWVLLDVRAHAVANEFGHGTVHCWAQDGTLLATATQTVRLMRPLTLSPGSAPDTAVDTADA